MTERELAQSAARRLAVILDCNRTFRPHLGCCSDMKSNNLPRLKDVAS